MRKLFALAIATLALAGCKADAPQPASVVALASTTAPAPATVTTSATVDPTVGAAPIASNFDVSTTLIPAWGSGKIPAVNTTDVVGAFRFICGAGQLTYDDPIVHPGAPGKSHLHQYYGNVKADAFSTFASLRASGDSTCNNMGNGTAANRSAYWMPAMLDGKGHVVAPDYVQVYYKREPAGSPQCTPGDPKFIGICVGIPNGIKFIAGYSMAAMKQTFQVGQYRCGSNVWSADKEALSLATNATCPAGKKLEATMHSGKCWNGELTSPDNISHLSEAVLSAATGWVKRCPSTHPYLLPQFTISAFYTVGSGDDVSAWSLSSDMPGMVRGSTLHFDYFEAWDNLVKDMWIANCIDKKLNCSGGDLGNGKQLKGASQPTYGWLNPNRLQPVPPVPAPPAPAHIQDKVAAEGDSISVYYAGYYTGLYDRSRANVSMCGLAVGGSGIGTVVSRLPKLYACDGEVVTLLIGANDLNNWRRTEMQWLSEVFAYTDGLRAKGYKVGLATVLPQCRPTTATQPNGEVFSKEHNRRRAIVNPLIRQAVGIHIDAVIDFAADPVMGPDSAACNPTLYRASDGLHPTDSNSAKTAGHDQLMRIYAPVVDRLLSAN